MHKWARRSLRSMVVWKRHFWHSGRREMVERDVDKLFEARRPGSSLPPPRLTPVLMSEDLALPRVVNVDEPASQAVEWVLGTVMSSSHNWHWLLQSQAVVESCSVAEIVARLGARHSVDASLAFFRWAATNVSSPHRHTTTDYNSMLYVLLAAHGQQQEQEPKLQNCIRGLLQEMREQRCVPDRVTFALLLNCRCCCRGGGDAVRHLLEALIRRYGEEEKLEEMVEVFDRSHGRIEWQPSLTIFEYAVNLLVDSGYHKQAVQLRSRMLLPSDHQHAAKVYKMVILALCRNKRMDMADELLQEMEGRTAGGGIDFHVYSAMVSGHCRANRPGDGLAYFHKMIEAGMEPSLVLHNQLIDCLGKAGYVDLACSLFHGMAKRGFKAELLTYNSLMAVLCKAGRGDEAMKLLARMKEEGGLWPDSVTYSIVIAELGKAEPVRVQEACGLFLEMMDSGCSADVVVHSTMMNLLLKSGEVREVMSFFKHMAQRGSPLSVSAFTTIIFRLVKTGRPSSAYMLFRGLQHVSGYIHQRVYNALICGFASKEDVVRALSLFKEMKAAGFAPDLHTYRTMVALLSRHAKLALAQDTLQEMKASGLTPDLITYNKLMSMLGETGDLKGAFKLLQDVEASGLKPDGYTYSALLHNLGRHRKVKSACKLFEELENRGHKPCAMTYNAFMGVLAMADKFDEALDLYRRMKELRLQPDLVTYDELIRLNERMNNERGVYDIKCDMARRRIQYKPRKMMGIKDAGYLHYSRKQQEHQQQEQERWQNESRPRAGHFGVGWRR